MTSQARSGRAEFTRIYLTSPSSSVEREISERREREQPRRLRRAERRLAQIQCVAAARGLPLPPASEHRERAVGGPGLVVRAAALLAAVSLAALLAAVVVDGPHGLAVEVADLAMLVTAADWLLLVLLRRDGRDD